MISLKNLSFRYNTDEQSQGVRHINLHIRRGECVVLCGESGCGKTTLLRLISGLAPAQYEGELEGYISIDGMVPSKLTSEEKASTIGIVFQDPRSQFFMSNVREEIAFTGENLGYDSNELLNLITKQVELLKISNFLDHSLNHLSSGQKQKVAIAGSCLLNPPVLILDEPTANLDAATTKVFIEILCKLKQNGTTIIISEHRLHDFLPVADRYVCLNAGEIAKEWNVQEFGNLSAEQAAQYKLRHPLLTKKFANMQGSAAQPSALYSIDKLSYSYKNSINGFSDVSAVIKTSSVTAVIGENGAGKTTLCKVLCGLLRAKGGHIYKDGAAMSKLRLRQNSYFVMQDADYQLFTESVGNELVLGQKVTGELRERAYTAMEDFGLTAMKDRHPASLSGGEKQRVTLAAACCSDSQLIVLDEPTSGLDAENALRVAKYVLKLCGQDKAVVIITHDPLLIALAGDNIIKI